MKIDWLLFVPALVLLFYPLDELLRGRVRMRDYERLSQERPKADDAWWRQPLCWVDPFRAFAGAWLLRNAWTIEPPLPRLWFHVPLFATLAVLILALGVQMHTRRDERVLYAPVGYSAGLVFAVLPAEIAVLVVVLAGACLMAFRGWSAFFLCGALGAAIFGYMILRMDFWMLASVVLLLEPLVLSMLAGRELLLPVERIGTGSAVVSGARRVVAADGVANVQRSELNRERPTDRNSRPAATVQVRRGQVA